MQIFITWGIFLFLINTDLAELICASPYIREESKRRQILVWVWPASSLSHTVKVNCINSLLSISVGWRHFTSNLGIGSRNLSWEYQTWDMTKMNISQGEPPQPPLITNPSHTQVFQTMYLMFRDMCWELTAISKKQERCQLAIPEWCLNYLLQFNSCMHTWFRNSPL